MYLQMEFICANKAFYLYLDYCSFFWHTPKKRTKKSVHKGLPSLMYPCCFARYTQKRIRVFAQTRAVAALRKFCFRRFKKTAKSEGISTERKLNSVGAGAFDSPLQCETNMCAILMG
jgi:hypothetical protein